MLDWDPVNAQDLASYEVQRAAPGGEFVTVAVVPSPTVAHVDGSLTDGEYRYRIRAVDTSGQPVARWRSGQCAVFSVEVEQPYTPTLETATEWRVRSVVSGQVVADLQSASGSAALPEQASPRDKLPPQTLLEPGLSTLTVRVRDGVGNRSKPFESQGMRSERPPAPSNVAATVNAHQVNLSWRMPAYPRRSRSGYSVMVRRESPMPRKRPSPPLNCVRRAHQALPRHRRCVLDR
ncbi:MAG: hypothetical protein IPK27_08310 [Rhodanobacteraceae bacterium]|nr:hypothetical protein [Rhodanobacteraceae bacterium]